MKSLALRFTLSALFCITARAQTDSGLAEQSVPARTGTMIFGLLLGTDTITDVATRVQLRERSICKISQSAPNCRPTYEIAKLGYIKSKGASVTVNQRSSIPKNLPPDLAKMLSEAFPVSTEESNLLFLEFSIDGEHLTGTFYKEVLVSLSVNGTYSEHIDSSVNPGTLIVSFDKKYKRLPSFTKSSTEAGVTDKYTYHVWKDPTGEFEVHLTRHDSILVNAIACLQGLRRIASSEVAERVKHRCDGSFSEHLLDYRAPALYTQAFEQARKIEADAEAERKKAATQKVNKY